MSARRTYSSRVVASTSLNQSSSSLVRRRQRFPADRLSVRAYLPPRHLRRTARCPLLVAFRLQRSPNATVRHERHAVLSAEGGQRMRPGPPDVRRPSLTYIVMQAAHADRPACRQSATPYAPFPRTGFGRPWACLSNRGSPFFGESAFMTPSPTCALPGPATARSPTRSVTRRPAP
jgi:hypothetical protein